MGDENGLRPKRVGNGLRPSRSSRGEVVETCWPYLFTIELNSLNVSRVSILASRFSDLE